jgi:hypothetical protein
MMTAMRVVYAAGFAALIQLGGVTATRAAYSVCAPADNIHRQHVVCGSAGCPSGEMSIFSTTAGHPMCGDSSSAQQAPKPQTPAAAPASTATSRSCGRHWSDWEARGDRVGNPCPSGCKRESKVREETRASGRRAEHRELWVCAPR